MNNNEAEAALKAQQKSVNAAINGLAEYRRNTIAESNWTAVAVKNRKLDEIKAQAMAGGVDLSTLDGKDAE